MQEERVDWLMPKRRIPEHWHSARKRLPMDQLLVIQGMLLVRAEQSDSDLNILVRSGPDNRLARSVGLEERQIYKTGYLAPSPVNMRALRTASLD